MFQEVRHNPIDLSPYTGEKFKEYVLEELLVLLVERDLPALIEKAQNARRRLPIPKQDVAALKRDFSKRCGPDIEDYKELISERLEGMVEECLDKIKNIPKDIYNWKRDRWIVKAETIDVDQWLFDRGKWRTILSEDNSLLMGTVLTRSGQNTMDWIGIGSSYDVLSKDALRRIASNARNAGWSIADTMYDRIRETMMGAVAEGLSIPHIRDKIREYMDVSLTKAEMIARTEVLKATNYGTLEAMKQSGVVVAKKWLTTDDDRTCPECIQMDGRTVELDKNFFDKGATFGPLNLDYEDVEGPPLHPDCRCTVLAEFNTAAPEWKINDQEAGHIVREGSVLNEAERVAAMKQRLGDGYKGVYGRSITDQEMKRYMEALDTFTTPDSWRLRRVQIGDVAGMPEQTVKNFVALANDLEQALKVLPKFKGGELRRGLGKAVNKTASDFIATMKRAPIGSEVSFRATSHWTTSEEAAKYYDGEIMLRLSKTKYGASVNYNYYEDMEVAVSKVAKYRIVKRSANNKVIWLEEL
jgi:SPP1 gp7 family putative phage head morphogenesis protein